MSGSVEPRLLERHPDQSESLLAEYASTRALAGTRGGIGELRYAHADAVGPVPPAVVRAHDPIALSPAQRQRGAAVDAEILDRMQAPLPAPRQTTTGSSSSLPRTGLSSTSAANATGCQQLRSACVSGIAAGAVTVPEH